MVRESVVVTIESGMHARRAGKLITVARQCESEVLLIMEDKIVNPKSILNLVAAAITTGNEVTVR